MREQSANSVGRSYGRLTVTGFYGRDAFCQCSCGNSGFFVRLASVRSGNTKSCGCLKREAMAAVGRSTKTHGLTRTPTYRSWQGLRARCLDPNDKSYPNYGGRGITVCERWADFANFLADMGLKPRGTSIERVDNDGPYSKGNCCWATPAEQNKNRRNVRWVVLNGERATLTDWCRRLGLNYSTVNGRICKRGWTEERALTEGVRP